MHKTIYICDCCKKEFTPERIKFPTSSHHEVETSYHCVGLTYFNNNTPLTSKHEYEVCGDCFRKVIDSLGGQIIDEHV